MYRSCPVLKAFVLPVGLLAAAPLAAHPYSLALSADHPDLRLKVTESSPEGTEERTWKGLEPFPVRPGRAYQLELVDGRGNLLDQSKGLSLALSSESGPQVWFNLLPGPDGRIHQAVTRGPAEQLQAFQEWVVGKGGKLYVGPTPEERAAKETKARGVGEPPPTGAGLRVVRPLPLRPGRVPAHLPPVPMFVPSESPTPSEGEASGLLASRDERSGKDSPAGGTRGSALRSSPGVKDRSHLKRRASESLTPYARRESLTSPRPTRLPAPADDLGGLAALARIASEAKETLQPTGGRDLGAGASASSTAGFALPPQAPGRVLPYVLQVTGLSAGQRCMLGNSRNPGQLSDLGAGPSPRLTPQTDYYLHVPHPGPGEALLHRARVEVHPGVVSGQPLATAGVVWGPSGAILHGEDAAWSLFLAECRRHNVQWFVTAKVDSDPHQLQGEPSVGLEPVPGPTGGE